MPKVMNFKVIVEQDEKGYFVAWAPSIPGCHSQGETYEEALKNVKEAIELCLEVVNLNPAYRDKVNFSGTSLTSKFLGIAEIPVRFNMVS